MKISIVNDVIPIVAASPDMFAATAVFELGLLIMIGASNGGPIGLVEIVGRVRRCIRVELCLNMIPLIRQSTKLRMVKAAFDTGSACH